jgi:hypothetical protein
VLLWKSRSRCEGCVKLILLAHFYSNLNRNELTKDNTKRRDFLHTVMNFHIPQPGEWLSGALHTSYKLKLVIVFYIYMYACACARFNSFQFVKSTR